MTEQNTTIPQSVRDEWERRGREHMDAMPPKPEKPKAWWKKPIVILPAACLLLGLGLGSTNRPAPERIEVPGPERIVNKTVEVPVTPQSCLTALNFTDQGFGFAAEIISALNDGLQAAGRQNLAGLEAANAKMGEVNPKFNALVEPAKAAKAECRASAK